MEVTYLDNILSKLSYPNVKEINDEILDKVRIGRLPFKTPLITYEIKGVTYEIRLEHRELDGKTFPALVMYEVKKIGNTEPKGY